jgi:cystathionine beta-lyase/cystathionine gamma-synthase
MKDAPKARKGPGTQTVVARAGRAINETAAVAPPIFQTTTFRAGSPEEFQAAAASVAPSSFYTRYGNPVHKQVTETIANLEGGEAALVTSSGMGAIFIALMGTLETGSHVIAQTSHYGGTSSLLRTHLARFGVESTIVDQTDPGAFSAALRGNTRVLYIESPTNPLLRLTDLRGVAEIARRAGVLTIIDSTFATPLNQRPLSMGIDVVVHSATKYIGGHHDVTAGVIVGSSEFVERAWRFSLVAGSVLSPFDGWLLLRGLRTLPLRVQRQNATAQAIAQILEGHFKVARVFYPGLRSHPQHALALAQMSGFGGVLSFELEGGEDAVRRFLGGLTSISYAASLGGYETVIVAPGLMWAKELTKEEREKEGISDGLLRLAVGLEDLEDLEAELEAALELV